MQRALALVVLTLSALLAFTPAPVRAAETITLRHAINSLTATNWPDFVASSEGFDAREGLAVETVLISAESMIAALIGGSVEIALANATQLAFAVDKGANIVAVGVGAENQPYHLMAAPSVKSFADLKGKNLALADAIDIYTTVAKEILKRNGLTLGTDVNVIYGNGQNQRYAAILGGAIQAGFFALPADADLKDKGYTVLAFTPDYYPHLTLSVNAVNRGWANDHPDALRRFLRARSNAIKWLYDPANENRAIEILATRTKLPRSAASAAYDYFIRKKTFPDDGCIRRPGLDALLAMLKEQGRLVKLGASDSAKLIDRSWCPR